MSWSDEDSKIVKNAHLLKKFELSTFDFNEELDAPGKPETPEDGDSFVDLGTPHGAVGKFIPLENKPGIIEKTSALTPGFHQGELEKIKDETDSLIPEVIELVRKAQEDMDRLKEESRRNCTLMEQEAWEKGFKEGEVAGREAGEKKVLPLLTDMNALLEEVAGLKGLLLAQYERELLDLIFSVSEKIIHCEISLDQRVIRETVLHTLQLASEKERLILRLNPEDVHLIEKLQTLSVDPSGKLTAVSLHADVSVSRGGCHLETPHGDIDASIETRLKKVYESLVRGFEEDGSS